MKNEFVPFELAAKLKELGFKEDCLACYWNEKLQIKECVGLLSNQSGINDPITAPLYQQVFNWFEEKYFITSHITYDFISYDVFIYDLKESKAYEIITLLSGESTPKLFSRREANYACVEKLIEIAIK